ncbi:GNAT family N-acetyltransferase [Estrella lausannensis]|uniref:Uncharacterized protein n=1 Tax=Estrella lausannensis TaxID=483423 RepID=A0A0H5DRZ4_9BACT|nr:GNAT family N-acetyltransferase [Estrella lausannensis]CRX39422.1 hypothetical protein ELAC_2101 [Estrella lausannensis]
MQSLSINLPTTSYEPFFQEGMDEFDRFLKDSFFPATEIETGHVKPLEGSCRATKKQWGCDYKIALIDKSADQVLNFGEIHFSAYLPSVIESQPELNPVTVDYIQNYKTGVWKGVGTHLIHIAYNASKLMGSGNVNVYALSDAVGFYEKMGFSVDWEHYEGDDAEGGVHPALVQKIEAAWQRCISRAFKEGDALHLLLDAKGKERLLERVLKI